MSAQLTIAVLQRRASWLCGAGVAAFLVAAAAYGAPGTAPPNYPNRPVTLIVPYGAGGVADTGTRILADRLTERLKQQFVVENRPGAGGIVAARAAASAAPDGYTMLMSGNNNAVSAALFKSLPYDILNDFASVSTTAFFELLIVTRVGSALKSVSDVVKAAREKPGQLNIASINPGSTQNLAAELFKSATGTNMTIVPFRTSSDMITAVLRGDVDIAFEFYAALQGVITDAKIVPLASTGPRRTPYLAAVPTVQESGIEDFEVTSWNGVSAPAATPEPVILLLNQAINDVLPAPDVQEKARQLGMEMAGSTPEAMTERLKHDIAKWTAVIEKAGIPKRD